jgi:hypothetical protein
MVAADDVMVAIGSRSFTEAQMFLERGFTFTYSERQSKIIHPFQINGKWIGIDESNNIISSTPNVFADQNLVHHHEMGHINLDPNLT